MSGSPANLEEALRGLGEDASQALQVHPGYEDLAAYSEGALPPTLTEAIDEHLAFCIDCADVVLELRRPSLNAGSEVTEPEASPANSLHLPKAGLLIAAGLAGLAALGLWWWSRPPAHAPQAVSELAQSERIPFIDPLGALRSDTSTLELTSGDPATLWGLVPASEPSGGRYRVRILATPGGQVWDNAIRPLAGPPSFFALRLDPAFFAPGRYRIEIQGRGGDGELAPREPEVWLLRVRERGGAGKPGDE